MGDLVVTPSSLPSFFSQTPYSRIIRRSSLRVTPTISIPGGKVVCNLRSLEYHSGSYCREDLLKCDRWLCESCLQLARHSPAIRRRKVCRKPTIGKVRGALVCDAHSVSMESIIFSGDLFGPSSSFTAKQQIKTASAFGEGVSTHNPPASNRARILQGINLLPTAASHVEKRRVMVHSSKSKPWWKQVLFQQVSEEDYGFDAEEGSEMVEGEFSEDVSSGVEENFDEDDIDAMLSDDQKFNSWRQKRYAIDELRDYQRSGQDPDNGDWEDWLDDGWGDYSKALGSKDGGWYAEQPQWEKEGVPREAPKKPERGMNRTIKELLLRIFETQEEVEDDLNFEERVFRYTSQSTAKFVTTLILVPWAVDFLVHDYLLVPFLRRWVEEVPLAAKVLDVKESQKLHMIERLKLERQRVRFEAEIGKAPPLSDEELNEHIRVEALELREDLREENRSAFANIWSDAVAGFAGLLLLVFSPQEVAIMRMTGDRVFTNISDTGKAFIIILCTDIFLGYHSESGWETVIEILLDHYGLEVSQGSIYVFVAIVPVTIDACFKLWVFRYLTRLSPSAAATFREMKRH